MSNDSTPPSGDPSGHEHRPNWGSAYPQQPGALFPPPGYGYQPFHAPPKHPSSTTAMVLGIVSVAGGFICYLPLLISPFAWFMGSKAVREIDASGGSQSGRGEALAGKVLGIIGTVLLALGIAAIIVFVVLALSVDDFWGDDYDYYESTMPAVLAGG